MINKSLLYSAFLLVGSSLFIASCGSGGSSTIEIDGSSTVYPVTEAVAEEYREVAPDTRVTVGVSGTGGGFKQFIRGEIDINNASREIKASEIELAEQNNVDYVRLRVAFDGISVVVHPENDWVDYVTVDELKKIWRPGAQGEITRWNQVREEWPDEELHLFGPGIASGTYDYFTEAIVGESGSSRGDYTASEDDNVLVQGVSTDRNALGFFGYAYYEENQDKLRLVPVGNKSGEPVLPSIESIKSGEYAPLSRPLFIYVSEQAVQQETVRNFVEFYLDNAGTLAREVGYIAMPDSAYRAELDKFRNFYKTVSGQSASTAGH